MERKTRIQGKGRRSPDIFYARIGQPQGPLAILTHSPQSDRQGCQNLLLSIGVRVRPSQ